MIGYEKQGNDFLEKTGTKMTVEYTGYKKHFDSDTEPRDCYKITLERAGRKMVINFGQSLNASGRFWKYGNYKRGCSNGYYSKIDKKWEKPVEAGDYGAWQRNENFAEPSAYDVLACLTKYDPGTFENFCSDFGYNTDSRSAEKTYNAVVAEYKDLCTLYSEAEMDVLREIS